LDRSTARIDQPSSSGGSALKWGAPFDPTAEAIWVVGWLIGRGGRRRDVLFLVDTGTPDTIVDQDLAVEVGLDRTQSTGPADFRAFSGPQSGYFVPADGIEVLGRKLEPFTIAACPFDPEFQIDGVLGLDFLRSLLVTLDFKHGRISLED
jgi:hypothetical protein